MATSNPYRRRHDCNNTKVRSFRGGDSQRMTLALGFGRVVPQGVVR